MNNVDKLIRFRTAIRDYLLALAEANEAESGYWKQQISATFIGYADRAVQEMYEHIQDNSRNPELDTANSIIKLLHGLPIEETDHAESLQRMLQRPGSVIPHNPQGRTDKIIIANKDATDLAVNLVKISMLRFLCDHDNAIKAAAIAPFNQQWLAEQINNIKRLAKNPHQFCPQHARFDFDDLERAFNAMNLVVEETIGQTKQLDNQTNRVIRKQKAENRIKERQDREKAKRRERKQLRAQEQYLEKIRIENRIRPAEQWEIPEVPKTKSYAKTKALGYIVSTIASYFAIAGGLLPSALAYGFFIQLAVSAVIPLAVLVSFKMILASLKSIGKFLFGAPQAPLRQAERAVIVHANDENGYLIERRLHREYSPQRTLNRNKADKRQDERQDRTRRYKRF